MHVYMNSPQDSDPDLLFSRCVKAGKRLYYFDVRRDKHGERYLALTESKRLKNQGDALHPVFEKHKLFVYHEDLEKFIHALDSAADYLREEADEAACEGERDDLDAPCGDQ